MKGKKQLIINLLAQGISFACGIGINFFITPFLIRHVGIASYGFIGLANDFLGYIQLCTIAINSMAARFISVAVQQGRMEKAHRYVSSVYFANLYLVIPIFLIGCYIIWNMERFVSVVSVNVTDVKLLWFFMMVNYLVSVVFSVYGAAVFVKDRLELSAMVQVGINFIRAIVLLLLFSLFTPYVSYIGMTMLLCTIIVAYMNCVFTTRLLPDLQIARKYVDISSLKEIISSGIWNVVDRISGILSSGFDLLLANWFVGAEAMGLLALSKTIPNLNLSLFGTLSSAFAPQFVKSFALGDWEEMKRQLCLSMKLLSLISVAPLTFIIVFGDVFYALWVPQQNAHLLWMLTLATCAAHVISMPMEGLWNIFTACNKVRVPACFLFSNGVLTMAIVLACIGSFVDDIEKLFLLAGVSTLFSIVRGLFFLPIYGAVCLRLKATYFYPSILRCMCALFSVFGLAFFIKKHWMIVSWEGLFGILVLVSIAGVSVAFYILLSRAERKNTILMIRKKLQKLRGDK